MITVSAPQGCLSEDLVAKVKELNQEISKTRIKSKSVPVFCNLGLETAEQKAKNDRMNAILLNVVRSALDKRKK